MASTDWTEKRKSVRASFGWPAALISGQGATIHGRVRDISSGGALVHIKNKLHVDDQIELAIDIPDFKNIISATGTIIRVNVLDKETSSPTYALGVHFTKMSSQGLEYFSGNLPSGWREVIVDEKKDEQETLDISNQTDGKPENTSWLPQWFVGGLAVAALLLSAITFSRLNFQNPPIIQDDLLLLSKGISKNIQSIREISLQQGTSIIQIKERLGRIENSSVSSDQVEKILSLLDFQIQDLQQIKKTLQKNPEISKKITVNTLSIKEGTTDKISTFHIVRPGETLFSISRQHGLAVDELLLYNALPKGTVIFSNQKLRLTSNSSKVQEE